MNFLLLFVILSSLSFAGTPPDCNGLGKLLQDYEKDLHEKTIKGCQSAKVEDLLKGRSVEDPEFLKDKSCLELGTIETQIEKLKAELAVLTGIEKLKSEVKTSKEKAGDGDKAAGLSFVDSLNTAQSLELLLSTTISDDELIIQALKKIPSDKLKNPRDLVERVNELCSKEKNKTLTNACNPKIFQPGTAASNELIKLITNEKEISTTEISNWQKQLAIKRVIPQDNDPGYSFHEMQRELLEAFSALDKDELMTKEHLRAIKKLDEFENASGLSFVENLSSLKEKKKNKILSDKFFVLIGDIKLRQQYEVQSKISVAWDNLKGQSPPLSLSEANDCDQSKNDYEKAKICRLHLEKAQKKLGKENLKSFLEAIRASTTYVETLVNLEGDCKNQYQKSGQMPESCFRGMTKNMAEVSDQILQLNILKDKIGSENQDIMIYRNFALKKWADKCQKKDASIDECEVTDTPHTISKDAYLTISDSMSIAIAFTPKSESEDEAKALCDNEEKKKRKNFEEKICAYFDDTTSDIIKTKNDKIIDGPTDAPDGNHKGANIRDAWISGGAQVLGQALNYFMPQQTPPPIMNPYQYNYSPYTSSAQGMGVADTILFNARFYGAYGYYMPTPGLRPYSAFGGSAGGPYSSISGNQSKYFGF